MTTYINGVKLDLNVFRRAGTINIAIEPGTTSNADDSIVITGSNGNALSTDNPGYVIMDGVSPGTLTTFTVTANVSIDLTGAHWGAGGNGDLADAILRVLALNNNGALVWGIALQGGREIILNTLDSATSTDINLPEEVLVSSALSADAQVLEVGWFKANFDDTGGAAEDLWAVQAGDGDLNLGSADGQWQPWNPAFTGFSADPGVTVARWTQIGKTVHIATYLTNGTSNATGFTMTLPIKAAETQSMPCNRSTDNGSALTTFTGAETSAGTVTLNLYPDPGTGGTWTAANSKNANPNGTYEAGP